MLFVKRFQHLAITNLSVIFKSKLPTLILIIMLSSFCFFRKLLQYVPERYSIWLGGGPEIKSVSKSLF